ncbi:DUF2155 domain-containing protein [Candidatus Pelagibacter sp.]|nr:DUF2155 domain-containing protein [Candidatus Pelagibacter sp.]
MILQKNIKLGLSSFLRILIFLVFFLFCLTVNSENNLKKISNERYIQIQILDKVSSKNNKLEIILGEEKIFKNLSIKILKCKNSEFDDNPEITAYLQVKDMNNKSNDEVFVFNGWTFSSSPSIRPFDHPVYDIWIIKCY